MSDIIIRPVRRDDLDTWWSLRLKALHDHPEAFGSDYETARARGPHYTDEWFGEGVNRLFGAYIPEGDVVAQAGVFGESGKQSHIANVISVYTHPDWRGRGISRRLVEAAIAHAKVFPQLSHLRISVNAENISALRIYERAGFEMWGREPAAIRTADGMLHDEFHLSMTLN